MKRTVLCKETNEALVPVSVSDGIEIYELPRVGTYRWVEELKGVLSTWQPLGWRDHSIRQWFFPNVCSAVYQFGSPLMALLDADDKNRATVALSDSVADSRISVSVDDLGQNDEIIFTVTLSAGIRQRKDGRVFLRIDGRDTDWDVAVHDAGAWMRSFLPDHAAIPENAKLPLYSSWYNFHQEPEQYLLEKELEAAAKMGFKTFILDDGWQFEGKNTGDYYKCGDWSVARDKFPDFKGFCDKVHSFGIKMLLWFPIPFVGYATRDYERYKNRIAYENDGFRAGILDVRYPEVREYIVGIYKRFVNDYGIDGLKLDFIDAFKTDPAAVAPFSAGMDVESLDGAARVLMDEIYAEMTALDPEFMFEFRQNYIGAEIVNRCNMLRVADCAADPVTNRIGMAALKLVNSDTAIHSDMLLWGRGDSPLNCARQLLNIMFAVPQISVRLTMIPEEQLAVLRRFISYWNENRDVLLSGVFRARRPDANYSLMSSEKDGKKITVLHCGALFEPCGTAEDVFNNTEEDRIVSSGGVPFGYRIFDMYGNLTEEGRSGGSTESFAVPRGGMIRVQPT